MTAASSVSWGGAWKGGSRGEGARGARVLSPGGLEQGVSSGSSSRQRCPSLQRAQGIPATPTELRSEGDFGRIV